MHRKWWALSFQRELTGGEDRLLSWGEFKICLQWMQIEEPRLMTRGRLWNSELIDPDNSTQALQGIGELMGILESALEELVLGVTWERRTQPEVALGHRRGDADALEMGVQRAQEDIGIESGFGLPEMTRMGRPIFKGKREMQRLRRPLVAREPLAKDLEQASRDEENRINSFDRRLKLMGCLVILSRAMQLQQPMVLSS
ncbi:hypothetical protein N9275_00510 [bacterium]|nr:hypothetical protein [bacterium]